MASKFSWFVAGVFTGLTAAAIGQELAKPPEERTWKGQVAGTPYNFRVDEWPDVVNEYWNPDSDEILTPHVIGIGWGVNFAALTRRIQETLGPVTPEVVARPVDESGQRAGASAE
jgi:hypothetical protein